MDTFFSLLPEAREEYILVTSQELGIPIPMVEKDCWVCWVLKTLFNNPDFGNNLSFRGGTSLSKAHQCIERFSEDIDIALPPSYFPRYEIYLPTDNDTPNQRNSRLRSLRKPYRLFIERQLVPYLQQMGKEQNIPLFQLEVYNLEKARDPFVVYLHYSTQFPSKNMTYVQPLVKLELSGRAQTEPSVKRNISSYVENVFPEINSSFVVQTVSPARTLWEKAFILHEENSRDTQRPLKERLARHYYDLDCLIQKSFVDLSLFREVAHTRKLYHCQTWVDYDKIKPSDLILVPKGDQYQAWKYDYEHTDSMIFGQHDSFASIVERLGTIQKEWKKKLYDL
ncbi:MAG: nucleotidyl transferase AbiEii/AbiGii toxin family protein [Akkermansia sp.]